MRTQHRKDIHGVVRTQRATKHFVCDHKECTNPIIKGSEYRRVRTDTGEIKVFHIPCYTREFPREEG